jgi:hypothetical protein
MMRSCLLAPLFVCACTTTSTAGGIRARAADEWSCPESSVSVTNEGQNVFRASGCGRTALYECSGGSEPSSGAPPQSEPGASERYRYEGAGAACHKASRD